VPALSATIPTVPGLDARWSCTKAQWLASLYVDNLTNRLGLSSYSDPTSYGQFYQALVSRPRTFGLTIGYSYQGW
jgi:outer membrane receptor protein involved in Fe transport